MPHQQTLKKPTPWIYGLQLDQDGRAGVRFCPAGIDEGIVFIRTDVPGHPEVRCCPDNLRSMPRWTALVRDEHWVHHTEHVLAAVAFSGLDNVRIEMDADRLPMMPGGTCFPFVEAIRMAGIGEGNAERKVYRLKKHAFLLDAQSTTGDVQEAPTQEHGRYIMAIPADHFSVTTAFHWPHMPSLPVGVAELDRQRGCAGDDILKARSYLVESEKEQVKAVLGPVQDHVMMLYPECPNALAIEAARHKIVDFVGDMMILGRPLVGRFVAVRAGHRIHHDMVWHLTNNNYLELVSA